LDAIVAKLIGSNDENEALSLMKDDFKGVQLALPGKG
jgi:hypothetical protein